MPRLHSFPGENPSSGAAFTLGPDQMSRGYLEPLMRESRGKGGFCPTNRMCLLYLPEQPVNFGAPILVPKLRLDGKKILCVPGKTSLILPGNWTLRKVIVVQSLNFFLFNRRR